MNKIKKQQVWQVIKLPLIIALLASLIFIIDSKLGQIFKRDTSFLWIAFASWTVFFNATFRERISGFLCTIIGFFAAYLMMLLQRISFVDICSISLIALISVFLVNGVVTFFKYFEKFYIGNLSGIFYGIFITFSGDGVNILPINNFLKSFEILIIYGLMGLIAGFVSKIFTKNSINSENFI